MSSDLPENSPDREAIAKKISEQIRQATSGKPKKSHPIRSAIFRGLGVLLPPLLTIVIFLWVGVTIQSYVIDPIFKGSRNAIIAFTADTNIIRQNDLERRGILEGEPGDERVVLKNKGTFIRANDGRYVPEHVYNAVSRIITRGAMPSTGLEIYQYYIEGVYLRPYLFIPALFLIFFILVYLIGKFIAVGIGRMFWRYCEYGIKKIPLISTVYNAIKEMIDFFFAEKEGMRFSRVVAVEWPRKGVWSLALVTGSGIPDIEKHVGEPHLSVMLPTAPIPMGGFLFVVKESETLALTITIDQAIQFFVSCGVVVPQVK